MSPLGLVFLVGLIGLCAWALWRQWRSYAFRPGATWEAEEIASRAWQRAENAPPFELR